jgi:multicomponent Na+:H+ antiporter subunit C
MELWLVPVISVLLGLSFFLLMQRSLSRVILGLFVLSNSVNLLIFTSVGLIRGVSPLIVGDSIAGIPHADPLPQALILTAIVIGMGLLAFGLALCFKLKRLLNIEDVDELREEE